MAENIFQRTNRIREERAGLRDKREERKKDAAAKAIGLRIAPPGSIEEKVEREAEEKRKRTTPPQEMMP